MEARGYCVHKMTTKQDDTIAKFLGQEVLTIASALDKTKYSPDKRIQYAKRLVAKLLRTKVANFPKLSKNAQHIALFVGAQLAKQAGGVGGEQGDLGWNSMKDYSVHDKSYTNDDIASKPSDKVYTKNNPTSDYTETVEQCKQNFLKSHPGTNSTVVENYCEQEFGDGGGQQKFGKRKTKQASMTVPYYVNLITEKVVYPEQPKQSKKSLKQANLEGAKVFSTFMTLHYRNSLPISGSIHSASRQQYRKKDDRPYYLQLSERLH